MKIRRLFIANRGEIAVRILRTAQQLGIETILGVCDADLDRCPRGWPIGACGSVRHRPRRATLTSPRDRGGAHGRGRRAAPRLRLPVGEPRAGERLRGGRDWCSSGRVSRRSKRSATSLTAREHAAAAGVPVVPGAVSGVAGRSEPLVHTWAFPVLIKAVGGGGGRGLTRLDSTGEMAAQLELAISEANAAFGDPRVYLERYVAGGRHIEVQLLGDERRRPPGHRDCSVQRRYQKLIEEAPAPGLSAALEPPHGRRRIRRSFAIAGAGTVEFLVDGERDEFYFLEVNARIQVEHPVTEMVSGLDLSPSNSRSPRVRACAHAGALSTSTATP